MTWVYDHTDESLLIMILLHSASNASIAFGGQLLPSDMADGVRSLVQTGWIPAITFAAWALILVVVTRGRLGYAEDRA